MSREKPRPTAAEYRNALKRLMPQRKAGAYEVEIPDWASIDYTQNGAELRVTVRILDQAVDRKLDADFGERLRDISPDDEPTDPIDLAASRLARHKLLPGPGHLLPSAPSASPAVDPPAGGQAE